MTNSAPNATTTSVTHPEEERHAAGRLGRVAAPAVERADAGLRMRAAVVAGPRGRSGRAARSRSPTASASEVQSTCQVAVRPCGSSCWRLQVVVVARATCLGESPVGIAIGPLLLVERPRRACSSPPRGSSAGSAPPARGCGSAPPSRPRRRRAARSRRTGRRRPSSSRPSPTWTASLSGASCASAAAGDASSARERQRRDRGQARASLLALHRRRDVLLRRRPAACRRGAGRRPTRGRAAAGRSP